MVRNTVSSPVLHQLIICIGMAAASQIAQITMLIQFNLVRISVITLAMQANMHIGMVPVPHPAILHTTKG